MLRRFTYFVPGVSGLSDRMLQDRGLLSRFQGSGGGLIEHVNTGCDAGPAGMGCLVAAGAAPAQYDPDHQRWIQGPSCWVGLDADTPPRPVDLLRAVGIGGYPATLADGQEWRVPLILKWDPERLAHVPNLPQSLTPVLVDGVYRYEAQVRPEYASVYGLAQGIAKAFMAESQAKIDVVFSQAAELLAVNYRLGIEEVGLLGLLDEATAVRILGLSIDVPMLDQCAEQMAEEGLHYEPAAEDE